MKRLQWNVSASAAGHTPGLVRAWFAPSAHQQLAAAVASRHTRARGRVMYKQRKYVCSLVLTTVTLTCDSGSCLSSSGHSPASRAEEDRHLERGKTWAGEPGQITLHHRPAPPTVPGSRTVWAHQKQPGLWMQLEQPACCTHSFARSAASCCPAWTHRARARAETVGLITLQLQTLLPLDTVGDRLAFSR